MEGTFLDFAKGRRSIRLYKNEPIPASDIEYFIEAATHSPSGCNSQNWHFVAISDRELIGQIAEDAERGSAEFFTNDKAPRDEKFIRAKSRECIFFKKAPLVIFVFRTPMRYYDSEVVKFWDDCGIGYREVMDKWGCPDILTLGAAIQTMLLAIHEKGYGACWMNDPVVAEAQIKRRLGIQDEDKKLVAVVPVGRPAHKPNVKKVKPLSEVLEIR